MKTHLFIVLSALASPLACAVTVTDGINMGTTNTVSTSSYSLAGGTANSVSDASFAFGDQNVVSQYGGAVGGENVVELYSMAVGYQNSVTGAGGGSTLVNGWANVVTNSSNCLVSGFDNELDGVMNSMALGAANLAEGGGQTSMAFGNGNHLDGSSNSILIGGANSSSDDNSWVMGFCNTGQFMTVTLGKYAATVADATLIVGNGTADNARANGLVVLNNGTVQIPGALTKAGSPVLNQADLNSARYMTKVTSGASLENDGYFALGDGAEAEDFAAAMGEDAIAGAENSFAFGNDSETVQDGGMALMGGLAAGTYSLATHFAETQGANSIALGGWDATYNNILETSYAQGDNSSAIGGVGSTALGFSSLSSGYWTKAKSAYSVALGSLNSAPSGSSSIWVETDALFELGNGWAARDSTEPSSTYRSNAIITLKNGHTTLTNKAWKAYVGASGDPLANPPGTTTDNGGEALLIEGHAHVKGRLTLDHPQGDLSMGIYD